MENQAAEHCAAEAFRVAEEVEYYEDRGVDMEDSFKSFESPFFSVYGLDHRIIERNHMLTWLDELPVLAGASRIVRVDGTDWMVYDTEAREENQTVAYVRVSTKLDAIPEATGETLVLFAILLPFGCALALFVGFSIARRALRPVAEMTKAASAIAKGDLSRRVVAPETHDEIGNLASTFNEMITSMQNAIERERQFSSDASHELRTPLAVILASAEAALADDATDAERQQALEDIMHDGGRMQMTLTQLLMLARGAEQAKAMEFSDIDLGEFVEDIAEACQAEADSREISLHIDSGTGVIVQADLLLLTRAALNLVTNAIKYGRPGGNVWVASKAAADKAVLSVRDDGIGIAPEHLPHVFERFYQVDPARSEEGSGLGLAFVKYIAELHNGSVSVQSVLGGGTEFLLSLPLSQAPQQR